MIKRASAFLLFVYFLLLAPVTNAATVTEKCKNIHKTYLKKCTMNMDMTQQLSANTALAYSHEACSDGSVTQLYLNRILASENASSYISCTVLGIEKNGHSKQEVITSLGTTLVVQTKNDLIETSVETKDGIVMCKASFSSSGAGTNDWCGIKFKSDKTYTEIKPVLASSDLTSAFYGKKSLAGYLSPALKVDRTAGSVQ